MVDFTPYVEQSTVTFEANMKQSFAYDCFRKLGLGYLYVVRNGKYMGLVSSSCSSRSHVVLNALQKVTKSAFMRHVQSKHQAQ